MYPGKSAPPRPASPTADSALAGSPRRPPGRQTPRCARDRAASASRPVAQRTRAGQARHPGRLGSSGHGPPGALHPTAPQVNVPEASRRRVHARRGRGDAPRGPHAPRNRCAELVAVQCHTAAGMTEGRYGSFDLRFVQCAASVRAISSMPSRSRQPHRRGGCHPPQFRPRDDTSRGHGASSQVHTVLLRPW
jgi:hypothetical protein